MESHPRFSFIIPFYGSVPLLKRALDSLVAQTDGDFEVIVVDDGSPEDGEDVTRSFGERFRYVRQPTNLSAFQARNRAAQEATGAFLVPVDPDDYVLPDLVARLRAAIVTSGADLIIYNVEQDAAGVITPHWCHYEAGVLTPDEALRKMVEKRLQWNVWAKAIRRDVWLKVLEQMPSSGSVYMNASEDFCIAVPLVLLSRKIAVIDFVGYRYWQNPTSICNNVSWAKMRRAIRDTFKARQMVLGFVTRKDCAPELQSHVKAIAHMILIWWVRECTHAVKKRLFNRGTL